MMATLKGQVKKTSLEAFSRPRADGIIAIDIDEGDQLLEAQLTGGNAHILLASSSGRSVRFHESDARPMGRNTRGVRGIALSGGEQVVGMTVFENDDDRSVLAISANGYGKRSPLDDYRVQSRGGKGILTMKTTAKTGRLVSLKGVHDSDDLMIVTTNGIMIRMEIASIRVLGRNTQGVRLISIKDQDAIADVSRIAFFEEEEGGAEGGEEGDEGMENRE
jgi:DNA gyrase subunit A